MSLNTKSRLPQGDEWSVWVDLASDDRPRYIGTEDEVKKEYMDDPQHEELLFVEDPNGNQFAWNKHFNEWNEL